VPYEKKKFLLERQDFREKQARDEKKCQDPVIDKIFSHYIKQDTQTNVRGKCKDKFIPMFNPVQIHSPNFYLEMKAKLILY
jgi:hypothetical protein